MLVRKELIYLRQGQILEYQLPYDEILLDVIPQFRNFGIPGIEEKDIGKYVRVVYRSGSHAGYYYNNCYQFKMISNLFDLDGTLEVVLVTKKDLNDDVNFGTGQGIKLLKGILQDYSLNYSSRSDIEPGLLRELLSDGLSSLDIHGDILNDDRFLEELRFKLNIITPAELAADLRELKAQIEHMKDQQEKVNGLTDDFKKNLEKYYRDEFKADQTERMEKVQVLRTEFNTSLETIKELQKSITKQEDIVEGYRNKMRALRKSRVI